MPARPAASHSSHSSTTSQSASPAFLSLKKRAWKGYGVLNDDIGVVVAVMAALALASTPAKNIPVAAATNHTILNPGLLLIRCADACWLLLDVNCGGFVRVIVIFCYFVSATPINNKEICVVCFLPSASQNSNFSISCIEPPAGEDAGWLVYNCVLVGFVEVQVPRPRLLELVRKVGSKVINKDGLWIACESTVRTWTLVGTAMVRYSSWRLLVVVRVVLLSCYRYYYDAQFDDVGYGCGVWVSWFLGCGGCRVVVVVFDSRLKMLWVAGSARAWLFVSVRLPNERIEEVECVQIKMWQRNKLKERRHNHNSQQQTQNATPETYMQSTLDA